jgi:hypothetical protein
MNYFCTRLAAIIVLLSASHAANAQPTIAIDSSVEPAAASNPTAATPTGKIVRFRQHPTAIGDQVAQRLGVQLALTTKITQSGQTAHESTNEMRRQQHRVIEVLEAAEGRATKVRATFPVSRRQSPENPNPDELAVQPIEGKTYFMHRDGDQVTLTDAEGSIPPQEEFKLVAESLENVGKPNPLALLLVDRHVAVGQRILVPRDMVQQLLGFDDPVGTVRRFELTLTRVEPVDEKHPAERAVFQTKIDIVPNDASPLTITLEGEMVVEIETCRLASVQLAGPVQLSSIERTSGGIFQYSAGGELNLAIRSEYGSK